jgi:hypothetical protein
MPGSDSPIEEKKVSEEEAQAARNRKFGTNLVTVTFLDDSAVVGSKGAKYESPIEGETRKRATWLARDLISVHLPSGGNKAFEAMPPILQGAKERISVLKAEGKTLKMQGDFNINFIETKENEQKLKVPFFGLDKLVEIYAKAGLKVKSITAPTYVTGKERGLIHINPQWTKVNHRDIAIKDVCFELEEDSTLINLTADQMKDYVASATKQIKDEFKDLEELLFPQDIPTDHALVGTHDEDGYDLTCNILESRIKKNDLYDIKNEDRVSAASNALGNFQIKLLAKELFSTDELAELFTGDGLKNKFDAIDFNTKGPAIKDDEAVKVSGVELRKKLEEAIKAKWNILGLYTKKGPNKPTAEQVNQVKAFAEAYYRDVYKSSEFEAYNLLLLPERQYNKDKIEEVIQANVTGGLLVAEADAKWAKEEEEKLHTEIAQAKTEKEKASKDKDLEAVRAAGKGTREAYIVDYIDNPGKLINFMMSGKGIDPSCKKTTSADDFTLSLSYQANGGFPEQPYMTSEAIDIAQARHFFNMAKEKVVREPIKSVHLVECVEKKHSPMFFNLIKLIVEVSRVNPKSLSDVDFETILGLHFNKEKFQLGAQKTDALNAIAYNTRLGMTLKNESEEAINGQVQKEVDAYQQAEIAAIVTKALEKQGEKHEARLTQALDEQGKQHVAAVVSALDKERQKHEAELASALEEQRQEHEAELAKVKAEVEAEIRRKCEILVGAFRKSAPAEVEASEVSLHFSPSAQQLGKPAQQPKVVPATVEVETSEQKKTPGDS